MDPALHGTPGALPPLGATGETPRRRGLASRLRSSEAVPGAPRRRLVAQGAGDLGAPRWSGVMKVDEAWWMLFGGCCLHVTGHDVMIDNDDWPGYDVIEFTKKFGIMMVVVSRVVCKRWTWTPSCL